MNLKQTHTSDCVHVEGGRLCGFKKKVDLFFFFSKPHRFSGLSEGYKSNVYCHECLLTS